MAKVRKLVAGRGSYVRLLALLGLKEIEHLEPTFLSAETPDQMEMLSVALGDNLWSMVLPAVKTLGMTYGPQILRKVWDWAKSTKIGTKANDLMKNYLGL